MSEFVYLFRTNEAQQSEAMGTPERAQKSMQVWLSWIRKLEDAGHLRDPGQPLALQGKVVRGPNPVISDGPYAEAKDLVLGFMIVAARNLEHAAELARDCPIAIGGGSVEIRPIGMSPSPIPGEAA